jgi:hypothetical protein
MSMSVLTYVGSLAAPFFAFSAPFFVLLLSLAVIHLFLTHKPE